MLQGQEVVQAISQKVQQKAHEQISRVVTKCLRAVFGSTAYEFQIRFERKRGKTEASLELTRDGHPLDPLDATGGGVVDICSFALRLAALVLAKPRRRRVLLLDEPMKHLSPDRRPQVALLLETLAKELKVQFIVITHSRRLAIGKVIEI